VLSTTYPLINSYTHNGDGTIQSQHIGVQVFKTVVGELMFSFGICRTVGECFDVSDEHTCVHLQGDMDAAVQCYTDLPRVDSLEKRRKHNVLHIHTVTLFLLLHHFAYLIHEAQTFLRSYSEPDQSRSYPTSHSLKIHHNSTLPPRPGSLKWSLSLVFPHQNPVCTSPLTHACYMPCPSHST